MGPGILSSAGVGVRRTAPEAFPDSNTTRTGYISVCDIRCCHSAPVIYLDGLAIRNANRGDSRESIRENRFAEETLFSYRLSDSRIASNLRFAIFQALKRDSQKRGFSSGTVKLGLRKGGKTYRAILGGETYHKVPPPKPVLEASESGICLVCARFLRRMTLREQRGGGRGESYHKGGGVQNRFRGGVLWYVFPSPEFPAPLFFSDDSLK